MNLYPMLKTLLFCLDAERSHNVTMRTLKCLQANPKLLARLFMPCDIKMTQKNILGLHFPNIVGLAAGLDKHAECLPAFSNMGFGFIETGTVTPKSQTGNDKPRMFRLKEDYAIINRMGFNSVGLNQYIQNIKSFRASQPDCQTIIGLNIGKNADTPLESAFSDYQLGLESTYPFADYISINISSPNTTNLRYLQHGNALIDLLRKLNHTQRQCQMMHDKMVPLFVKIAPDNSPQELNSIADICLNEGINGIIATNTTISREQLNHPLDKLAKQSGGLSGAPLSEMSTKVVEQLANRLQGRLPIIAAGGIMNEETAKDKLNAGADLLQIYSGFIYKGPKLIKDILNSL